MFSIPVGSNRTMVQGINCRDPRQQTAVKQIVDSSEFDFALSNPFAPDCTGLACSPGYTGPFNFTYYTKDGRLNTVKVYKSGKLGKVYSA